MASGARRVRYAAPRRIAAVKFRLDLVVLIACALLLALLGYERGALEKQRRPSVYSTYDTGPNGYRAFYEVLRTAGTPVRRFEREIGTLDPSIRTLIVTGYEQDPAAKPLDARDAAILRGFVAAGGRMVVIDAAFEGPLGMAPGVGTALVPSAETNAIPLARNAYTEGTTRVSGSIDWVFRFKDPGVPLLANDQGIAAESYRYGRGEVVAITAPSLFGNAELRNADNLRFAYNAVANHGAVAFDEYVHGYDDRLTMWSALPRPVHAAVWLLVTIVGLALIGANIPFAPPYLPEPPDERDSSAYIAAMAELMRRSRRRPADDDVIWQAAVDFQRRKEHA